MPYPTPAQTAGDDLDEVLPLIESIYDTVMDPGRWPETLEKISHHIGKGCAGISLIDTRTKSIRVAAHWGAEPHFLQAMMQSVAINPATTAHWYMEMDEPFTVESLMGEDSYYNSRFYKTVNLPHDCSDGLISILSKSGDRYGNISLPRWNEHGPIKPGDLMKLKRLSPHIRRAVTLTDLLDMRAFNESVLSQTFDHLTTAIILVDADGRIAHANRAADTLMAGGRTIRRTPEGRLMLPADAEKKLKGVLAGVGRRSSAPGAAETRLYVTLEDGDPGALTAWIMPLDTALGRETVGGHSSLAAIFISDKPVQDQLPGDIFVRQYSITPAECRVLGLLAQGTSPADAADILGVSIHTVRSHMAQLFAKTNSRGLPDLLHFIQRHLAPVA